MRSGNSSQVGIVRVSSFNSNKESKQMPRKTITVSWDSVTAALTSGQLTKIEQFASQYNISRPTAKKMLAEKYGNAIVFNRGRAGGIVFNPSASAVTA